MHLLFSTLALTASLHLPAILAAPTCGLELEPTDSELYAGYGADLSHYCKRSPAPAPNVEAKRTADPDPLMISNPFGLGDGLDGGGGGGGGGGVGPWGGTPEPGPINAGAAYQACYVIYSSARVKRELGLDNAAIEKRCNKAKAKRSAEPEPWMIADPFGLDGGGGGGGGGGDGGAELKWPGDMGDGFLQCYTTYTTDKKTRALGDEGLEKRCRKAKRQAEDMVIKREVRDELFERNRPHYDDYEDYGSVPV